MMLRVPRSSQRNLKTKRLDYAVRGAFRETKWATTERGDEQAGVAWQEKDCSIIFPRFGGSVFIEASLSSLPGN
jgi:hypothetical protein